VAVYAGAASTALGASVVALVASAASRTVGAVRCSKVFVIADSENLSSFLGLLGASLAAAAGGVYGGGLGLRWANSPLRSFLGTYPAGARHLLLGADDRELR